MHLGIQPHNPAELSLSVPPGVGVMCTGDGSRVLRSGWPALSPGLLAYTACALADNGAGHPAG